MEGPLYENDYPALMEKLSMLIIKSIDREHVLRKSRLQNYTIISLKMKFAGQKTNCSKRTLRAVVGTLAGTFLNPKMERHTSSCIIRNWNYFYFICSFMTKARACNRSVPITQTMALMTHCRYVEAHNYQIFWQTLHRSWIAYFAFPLQASMLFRKKLVKLSARWQL